jgi:hypothetical protein
MSDEKIYEEPYICSRQMFENNFKNKLDKLNEATEEPETKESFDESKF